MTWSITDGPYAETKEALTGFYLIEAADLDEAITIAADLPAAWDGAVELRPVIRLWADRERVDAQDRLAEVIRIEGARLQATLVRTLGDWSLAEEAVQEAAIAALRDWAASGLPDHPRAWLTATARRKAIDIIRRERVRGAKEQAGAELMELTRPDDCRRTRSLTTLRSTQTCCG